MPVLKVGDEYLYESMIVVDYLSEEYGVQIWPKTPLERAKLNLQLQNLSFIKSYYSMLKSKGSEGTESLQNDLK